MKSKMITLLAACCFLVSCSNVKMASTKSIDETAFLLKQSLDNRNYDAFQSYLTDPQKNKISKEQFEQLSANTTSTWLHDYYSVITFSNGEMLLVNIVKDQDHEGYFRIQNVKQVPDEMKKLLKGE